jgi:formylglycine-generating enzyme required for sulfatase activity
MDAYLYIFHDRCPPPGQEEDVRPAYKEVQPVEAGGFTVDVKVPFRELLVPPGPTRPYCARIVYQARNQDQADPFPEVPYDHLRLAHQDGQKSLDLRPYQPATLTFGDLAGAGPVYDHGLYDHDGDGISNLDELRLGLRPTVWDGLDLPEEMGLSPVALGAVAGFPLGRVGGFANEVAGTGDDEHTVMVDVGALEMDAVEVTNRQYRACMGRVLAGDSSYGCPWPAVELFDLGTRRVLNPAADLLPVVGVTHVQAQAFCRARGMRLPTEVEWERAARHVAGAVHDYPWGGGAPVTQGAQNPCSRGRFVIFEDGSPRTCADRWGAALGPVSLGTGPARPGSGAQGIFDLAGNVAEWTEDAYLERLHEYLEEDPTRGGWFQEGGHVFTVRGGSFRSGQRFVTGYSRAGVDDTYNVDRVLDAVGFRCVR